MQARLASNLLKIMGICASFRYFPGNQFMTAAETAFAGVGRLPQQV